GHHDLFQLAHRRRGLLGLRGRGGNYRGQRQGGEGQHSVRCIHGISPFFDEKIHATLGSGPSGADAVIMAGRLDVPGCSSSLIQVLWSGENPAAPGVGGLTQRPGAAAWRSVVFTQRPRTCLFTGAEMVTGTAWEFSAKCAFTLDTS